MFIAPIIGCVWSYTSFANSVAGPSPVHALNIVPTGFHITVSGTVAGCGSSNIGMDTTDANYDAYLSTILAAYATEKKITITYGPDCVSSGHLKIKAINIETHLD